MSKPFSWSWSRLKNWRTCPKRFYEIDVAKNYVEPEAGALKWGHEVHEALANRIAKGAPLPESMRDYDVWPQKMIALGKAGTRMLVENKLAMSQEFTPTRFFDADTWFRGVVDVLGIGNETAISLDWKTGGKISPEFEQLGLSAQLIFANYPKVNEVQTAYIWLGHTDDNGKVLTTKETYRRENMVPLWNELWPEINQMTEAHRTVTYPPNPSGLCKRHCPVVSCPYHGKGSR